MSDCPVMRCMLERRSIRRYTDEPVRREDIETILEAARWSPSGMNNQPWRFLVMYNQEVSGTDGTGGPVKDHRIAKLAEISKYSKIINEAKVVIAVFLCKADCYNVVKDHQVAGAVIQNMLLAVHSLGLGAVWLGEIINHGEKVVDAMLVDPGQYELMTLLTIGHPAQKGSSERKPLSHFMLEVF